MQVTEGTMSPSVEFSGPIASVLARAQESLNTASAAGGSRVPVALPDVASGDIVSRPPLPCRIKAADGTRPHQTTVRDRQRGELTSHSDNMKYVSNVLVGYSPGFN